jgi:hypothetical protein
MKMAVEVARGLAKEILLKERSLNDAASYLNELTKIPVSSTWDMVYREVAKLRKE